jgi:hypothetical protein
VGSRNGRDSLHKGSLLFLGIETLFLGCLSLSRVAIRSKLFIFINYSMGFINLIFNIFTISNRSLENTG